MENQTALNEIFNTLSNIGMVDTKREFYEDWLNRSEGYVRYLKHANKQPSTDALAVFSSKLKLYSELLQQKKKAQMPELASVFTKYSTKLELIICDNSTSKWMQLMDEKSKATVHCKWYLHSKKYAVQFFVLSKSNHPTTFYTTPLLRNIINGLQK